MRLGDMLVAEGLITEEQVQQALKIQKQAPTHTRLGEVLINNKFISESQLVDTLSRQLGIDYIDLSEYDIDAEMVQYIPKQLARKYSIVPVKVAKNMLFLAMQDPLNFEAVEEARRASKMRIIQMIGTERGIRHAITTLYSNKGANEAIMQMKAEAGIWNEATEQEEILAENDSNAAPTIKLVNSIIERAYVENASDIHFEPSSGDMRVRMRIDGRLHNILVIPRDLQDSVISRLKIMSHMNLVERRIPQDGRAKATVQGKSIDLRVSTLPSISGEKVVIRLLVQDPSLFVRSGIGIPEEESAKLDHLMAASNGVIMIVGPTGSGKSSTMYTLIQELLDESVNLVTLEDPVEFSIEGATQVNINEKTGLTFASGLRSILRQDPDIICVGEIRDGETAEIAMRAAMTGHKVITTIHTENAISAIDRLKDMGVEPYLIAGGLTGIISQRLVRCICKNCREEYTPEESAIKIAGLDPSIKRTYYHGAGCDECFHTGYRGRTGVFEILSTNRQLRHAIAKDVDKQELLEMINETGFVSMQDCVGEMVEDGITTVEEIGRVMAFMEY
ncbi:GspE/PulE family protein [Granulicatella balaenopterae]|nr:GspE/PulE family protein [Granulicatella balaenopterae]